MTSNDYFVKFLISWSIKIWGKGGSLKYYTLEDQWMHKCPIKLWRDVVRKNMHQFGSNANGASHPSLLSSNVVLKIEIFVNKNS